MNGISRNSLNYRVENYLYVCTATCFPEDEFFYSYTGDLLVFSVSYVFRYNSMH
ncbi:hypothetical protein SAMN05216323_105712 [Williamwhitmania taraxaci]|uniref:Uncharacterized protein n=1 Tax=Williamwhitmania taraxaci TaxID=1640674 RepID=A0A1G6Q227_9BACT|nr:hypothetical protein SAMN05216323_105712 [Williamwhitmania taraxaci]